MGWWAKLFRKVKDRLGSSTDVPLPVLVHSHPRGSVPPGPLEEGIIALEQEDEVLHAVAGVIQSDGTISDLPPHKLEWARRLTYQHLKREGCLAEFGIPRIPTYEADNAGQQGV
jgi:hypothetical protein